MAQRFSPTKSKVNRELQSRRNIHKNNVLPDKKANYNRYFCHYKNGIYMGGMNDFIRHGKGIILLDDGSAAITEYRHGILTGHNIIFRENSMTSVLYKKSGQYEVLYKISKKIIKIPFGGENNRAHGQGLLIDYENYKIYKLIFKRGSLIQKILHQDRKDNEQVFNKNSITRLVGVKHQQVFQFTFDKPEDMHIKFQKNKLTIGFFDQDGEMNGLGFKFYLQNGTVSGQKSFYLKSIEKGYYRQSKLDKFGQKWFSNGNKYIGQFQKGDHHGYGIFLCPTEMIWIYGKFNRGKLADIIDFNHKKFAQNGFQIWNSRLRQIHQKQRYIGQLIQLPQEMQIYQLLKDSQQKIVTQIDPDHEQVLRQQQQRLSRIQYQFQEGSPGSRNSRSVLDNQLEKYYMATNQKKKKPFNQKQKINFSFPAVKSGSGEPSLGERQYRTKDPFSNQLFEIPFRQKSAISKEDNKEQNMEDFQSPPRHEKKRRPDKPNDNGLGSRNSREHDQQSRIPNQQPFERIYNQIYLQELERQRQKLNLMALQDKIYMQNLRRELERSPIHRDQYPVSSSPSREPRQFGRITPKRYFNYKDPSDKIIHKWRDEPLYQKRKQEIPYERREQSFVYQRSPKDNGSSPSKNLSDFQTFKRRQQPEVPINYKKIESSPSKSNPYRTSPTKPYNISKSSNFMQNNFKSSNK